MNQSNAENFMRSAKPPAINAGVMIANVIWNAMYTDSGIVGARWLTVILFASFMKDIPGRKKRSKLPMYGHRGGGGRRWGSLFLGDCRGVQTCGNKYGEHYKQFSDHDSPLRALRRRSRRCGYG